MCFPRLDAREVVLQVRKCQQETVLVQEEVDSVSHFAERLLGVSRGLISSTSLIVKWPVSFHLFNASSVYFLVLSIGNFSAENVLWGSALVKSWQGLFMSLVLNVYPYNIFLKQDI